MVTTMDGIRVDSLPKYTAFLYVHKRNTPIRMEVLRDGKPLTVSVTPVNAPPVVENLSDLINPKKDLIAPLGIFVIDLKNSVVGLMLNLRSDNGVLVAGLLGGEPAIAADLAAGDVIRAINGTAAGQLAAIAADACRLETGRCGGARSGAAVGSAVCGF